MIYTYIQFSTIRVYRIEWKKHLQMRHSLVQSQAPQLCFSSTVRAGSAVASALSDALSQLSWSSGTWRFHLRTGHSLEPLKRKKW